MVPLLVLAMIIACITVDGLVQRAARRKAALEPAVAGLPHVAPRLGVRGSSNLEHLPPGVFVGPGHTWIHLEPTGSVRMGVDMLPVTLLGGVDSIDALPAGNAVREGQEVVTLRRGDRTVALRSPVDGVVDRVNRALLERPEALCERPDHSSWIVRVTPARLACALDGMAVGEDAATWMLHEDLRLRELASQRVNRFGNDLGALPGGDVPLEGLAGRLDEHDWQALLGELLTTDVAAPAGERSSIPRGVA